MSMQKKPTPPTPQPTHQPTPRRLRKSIKLDRVQAIDLLQRNMIYSCEQCSHYDPENDLCTLGFQVALHKKAIQLQRFDLHGHMAFCRFTEID